MAVTKKILCAALASLLLTSAAQAASKPSGECGPALARTIPNRPAGAPSGSDVMAGLMGAGGSERDAAIARQVLAGNVPGFLRDLMPVNFSRNGVRVTICVTPDYLAVGSNRDFVRTPLGLPTAARIADRLGFFLPTPGMVDAIYAQARLHLKPAPMTPGRAMTTTRYFLNHNTTVDHQIVAAGAAGKVELTAGQKKDLVFSKRLIAARGKVAIYGWHRTNGKPIQPLSTVHGASYADYSHGIRLVSDTAYVDGAPVPLADIMDDPKLAPMVSSEGPIARPHELLASLYR